MKNVIFVMPTISCGGAEKALIELLNNMDYSTYKVDLMLFRKDDMYYQNQIPKEVNILENDDATKLAFDHVKHLIKSPLFIKKINVVLCRIWQTSISKIYKIFRIHKHYYDWKTLRKCVPNLKNEYDVAIGYLEGNAIYYVADKINAKKKIGFFHTNYKKAGFNKSFDLDYFRRINCLYAVSESMANELKEIIPEISEKIRAMPNILNVSNIQMKANEEIEFDNQYEGIRIISVGNLRYVKGYDLAIKSCKILKDKGYKFKWYVLGEGKERGNLERLIKQNNVEDMFILLGLIQNPYAYIKRSDIYVQLSRYEGLSTTVREAKILQKPIVITDCPGMKEQIEDGKTGSITSYEPSDIAIKIAELIDDIELKTKYINNLYEERDNNSIEEQMKILYNEL